MMTCSCGSYKIEKWKSVENYPRYMISNLGRVKSPRTEFMKPWDNGRGYSYVLLQKINKKKNMQIHRLVADAFIPNPLGLKEVNHKDGNKKNNNYWNLEWISRGANMAHASKNDLIRFGESKPGHKLTEQQVIDILTIHHNNPKVNKSELSRKYNVSSPRIHYIITGQRWRRIWIRFHAEHSAQAIKDGYSIQRTI